MQALIDLYTVAQPYFAHVALAATWIGLAITWWRRRRQWGKKEFLGHVNFSLNLFGETLKMRTLVERPTAEVWPNAHGLALLDKAARRTTEGAPFVQLANPGDRDYVHRAVKNVLSALCPTAFIGEAVGGRMKSGVFLFALTCERYEEGMRTVKLRVILVEQAMLRGWCAPEGKAHSLQLPHFYATRLKTILAMYEMDRAALAGAPAQLGRVELGVPVG